MQRIGTAVILPVGSRARATIGRLRVRVLPCHLLRGRTNGLGRCTLVIEPLRGTGLGRQIMDAFEQWAKDRQSVLVSLTTRGAAAFYEHRGYTSKAGYYKKYLAIGSPQ